MSLHELSRREPARAKEAGELAHAQVAKLVYAAAFARNGVCRHDTGDNREELSPSQILAHAAILDTTEQGRLGTHAKTSPKTPENKRANMRVSHFTIGTLVTGIAAAGLIGCGGGGSGYGGMSTPLPSVAFTAPMQASSI